jgi:GNAT superfamily N-acetyltransferase
LIAAGEMHVLEHLGEIVATCGLKWKEPEHLWGLADGTSAYVTKLATRRAVAGHGLGHRMLTWAERRAAREGKALMRLDCAADQPRICEHYREAGYTLLRIVEVREFRYQLCEKRLAPEMNS